MNQIDFMRGEQQPAPFKDIRSTRPSTAEQKAQLLLRLGKLINRAPISVQHGSINTVREWTTARKAAAKTAASSRASITEISSAITSMERWS